MRYCLTHSNMPSSVLDLKVLEEKAVKKIQQQINYFTAHKMPGVLCGFNIDNVCNGDASQTGKDCFNNSIRWLAGAKDPSCRASTASTCREVQMLLTYAGRALRVLLLFSPRHPWMPPDLWLEDEAFMEVITLDTMQTHMQSLESWPLGRESAVADLAHQIHSLYKQYQILMLHTRHPDLLLQYRQFFDKMQLSENDIEVYISSTEHVLCVRLPVLFEELPLALFTEERGLACCVLQFVSTVSNFTSFAAALFNSPRAESLLVWGGAEPIKMPPIPPGCSSLMDHAATIVSLVSQRIKQAHISYDVRKQIVAQLLCQYDAAMSQYDEVRFTKVELLLQDEAEDFHYLADIVFPHGFPQDCGPSIRLRSICQEEGEEQKEAVVPGISKKCSSLPDEILEAMMKAITGYAPTFRRTKCRPRS